MDLSRSFICKVLISLVTMLLVSMAPFALAQEQIEARHVPRVEIAGNEQRFLIESDLAIGKMSLGMTAEPSGDVDADFIAMMMAHQQGAIDVAAAELKYSHNEALRRFARDMIAEREHEMLLMRSVVGQSTDTPETTLEHATSGRSKKELSLPKR